jgi:hypothetical protein
MQCQVKTDLLHPVLHACLLCDMQVGTSTPVQSSAVLLDPSTAAMLLVLQQPIQFDPCSLACLAVTCSTLSHAVLARSSNWAVRCDTSRRLDRFTHWLGGHSSSLSSLMQCSIAFVGDGGRLPHLRRLPCPGLRQLHLKHLRVQLGPGKGRPGVLHDCPSLTALDFVGCRITHRH